MGNTLADIRARSLRALIPPLRLRLSDWIEANVRLPVGTTALPGPVRLWPYQREIADAISDPIIERVTLVKPVRVGFTTLLTGAIGSFVANEPAPILALLPTEADCRDYIVSDVEPLFEASPTLRGLLAEEADESGRNTLLSRRFPGGSLRVVAARAPRNLRRMTARVLLVDEADGMEITAEGSPVRLAEKRTMSFANRKVIVGSTPTTEDGSTILRLYGQSDMRVYEVPCPSCGGFTEIKWQHIEWDPDRPETAAFRCPHCSALVHERFKAEMVSAGRWRATRPEILGHAGFRISALVSLLPNASWGKLAGEFLQAKDSLEDLQVFTNTILAEAWREGGDELVEAEIAARAEPFSLEQIPADVLAITAGCDVQDDRIEMTVCGWTRGGDCLVLGHLVIWGVFADDSTLLELDAALRSKFQHPLGGEIRIDAACVDASDGGHYARVLSFCAPRSGRKILAIKGASGTRPIIVPASKAKRGIGRLWICGVDNIKAGIFGKLARGRSIRFSDQLEPSWFEQLCSERRIVRVVRGQPVRRFERKPGYRAEALDCLVYNFAARAVVTFNPDDRADELREAAAAKPAPSPIRSSWMSR